jgi:predicted ATPase
LRDIELIGRDGERDAVWSVLAAARGGMSATLVVRGEAGIGKTSILEYAVSAADGFTTLRADGVESEQDISFAAVHRLLVPLLPAAEALPPPQRMALDATLGLVAAEPPDRFLVALAVLTLLTRQSERGPLLCVVDDAQWIDGESAGLLAFVSRRLYAEQMVMLFAVRDPIEGRDPLVGLPEIRLTGLQPEEARRLLTSVSVAPLDPAIIDRVVARDRGQPARAGGARPRRSPRRAGDMAAPGRACAAAWPH